MRFCRKTDTGEYFIATSELMARDDMMLMPTGFDPRAQAPEPAEGEPWDEPAAESAQAKGRPGRPRKA